MNSADQIYKCKKPCNGSWIVVDGGLKQIDGGEKYVYGVNICDEKLMGLTAGGIFQASSHTSQPRDLEGHQPQRLSHGDLEESCRLLMNTLDAMHLL